MGSEPRSRVFGLTPAGLSSARCFVTMPLVSRRPARPWIREFHRVPAGSHGLSCVLAVSSKAGYRGTRTRPPCGSRRSYLSGFRKSMEWDDALDELEGTNAVPIMTIHKSKGLEYHTVVFVGFEDSAFWNFHKKPTEETWSFFVAFSRAKIRVIFTLCEHRAKPADASLEPQHRATVGPLYGILEQAGVEIEHIDG